MLLDFCFFLLHNLAIRLNTDNTALSVAVLGSFKQYDGQVNNQLVGKDLGALPMEFLVGWIFHCIFLLSFPNIENSHYTKSALC